MGLRHCKNICTEFSSVHMESDTSYPDLKKSGTIINDKKYFASDLKLTTSV